VSREFAGRWYDDPPFVGVELVVIGEELSAPFFDAGGEAGRRKIDTPERPSSFHGIGADGPLTQKKTG
jgi:hypothetical protein